MRYLTPAVLRSLATGLPLTEVPDADLAALIEEAESLVDAECGVDEGNNLGLSYGQRTEDQLWNAVQRRVNPVSFPVPVQSIQNFVIQYAQNLDGTPALAPINTNQIVINNDYGYVEITTLAVVLSGIADILAFTGIIAPIAIITYTAGYQVTRTNERLFLAPASDGLWDPNGPGYPGTVEGYAWQSRWPFWQTTSPVSVSVNGTLVPTSAYTVNYGDGSVLPGATWPVVAPGSFVTASFTGTIPQALRDATKGAFQEVAGEYLLAQEGMPGLSTLRSGVRTTTRRTSDAYTWRSRCIPFKRSQIYLA